MASFFASTNSDALEKQQETRKRRIVIFSIVSFHCTCTKNI